MRHLLVKLVVLLACRRIQASSGGIGPEDPIIIAAQYLPVRGWLSWSFPLFYGWINQNLNQIFANVDLYYDKSIFVSDDLNPQGISCTVDFECSFVDKETYIVENSSNRLIATHAAGVPVYLSPFLNILQPFALPKLQFFYNKSDKSFVQMNVLGMAPESVFWPYLALTYRTDRIFILFETRFKWTNYRDLLENMSSIQTTLTLFPQIEMQRYYKSVDVDMFSVKSVQMSFVNFTHLVETTFSYEDPFVFRICETLYPSIVVGLTKAICMNPNKCQTESNLYADFDGRAKMKFSFYVKSEEMLVQDLLVEFAVTELFSVDSSGFIIFNFGSFKHVGNNEKYLILGLLFLRKVNLMIEYHDFNKSFDLFLWYKERPLATKFLQYFMIASLCLALFVTIYLIQANTNPSVWDTLSEGSHSLYG